MPKQTEPIFTERQAALDTYIDEREKMSADFYKVISTKSRRINAIKGVISGATVGLLVAILFGSSYAYIPRRDANGKVTEYKFDKKHMTKAGLSIIAVAILAGLVVAGVENLNDSRRNRNWSSTLADTVMKRYFNKPLQKYRVSNEFPLRSICAAALIMNNLPESECARLRALTTNGMTRDEHGYYSVANNAVAVASELISNYIRYNPELEDNIVRIMDGKEPTTYFLPDLQKTR